MHTSKFQLGTFMHAHITTTITVHLNEGFTCLHNYCINLMQSICSYRTRSNLRNVLIIGMQDLIDSNLWNE